MSVTSLSGTDPAAGIARSVRRKVAWRVLPLLFVIYVIAYLDRANVGFAKLSMQVDLKFSEEVFGWGFGMFFVGYLVLEIPGALLVEHWSARKWFARILITWGFCSMGMALVQTPNQFYLARFLLGLAEAGFFPGVIVYTTHWFPRRERARALSVMLLAIPISLASGARISGLLVDQNWFGYTGWQWIFLAEGAPAVILGILVLFLITDRPRQARWLTPAERDWLENTLEAERQEVRMRGPSPSLGQALRLRRVWLLALGIFATNIGGYAFVLWMPTSVKGLLSDLGRDSTDANVLNWMGLIYFCGLLGVFISGWLSDRAGEHKWHCFAGQVGTAVFLVLSILPGQTWSMVFVWLCLAGFFANFWFTPFWVLPTLTLTSSVAAVSIGFINMCGNLAGLVGSAAIGEMKTAGLDDRACLLFLAANYAIGGLLVAALNVKLPSAQPKEQW
jgi:ACS family tartrate transporter-like MFS transporter